MEVNILLWVKGNPTAPLNLSLNTPLFSFAIITIVMSYYDDYIDDDVLQADVYATSTSTPAGKCDDPNYSCAGRLPSKLLLPCSVNP